MVSLSFQFFTNLMCAYLTVLNFVETFCFSLLIRFLSTVPDEIVIDIIKKKIISCEKECRNWIVEGFPRTKV